MDREFGKNAKTREGVVTSDKMAKTVTVLVERTLRHPFYGKTIRDRKAYKAHDEKSECKTGDRVLIEETRPLSRTKRWKVREVLERAR